MNNRILVFIDWFYPAYKAGGPIKSVYNLVKGLEDQFQFMIVSSNQEIDGSPQAVETDTWTVFEDIPIIYLRKKSQNKKKYRAIFEDINPHAVYYNSLFSINFTIKPYLVGKKLGKKQIIAPRGMFGKASLAIKPFKKKLFLAFAKQFLFKDDNLSWHATSNQEEQDIKSQLGNSVTVKLARNLAAPISKREKNKIDKNPEQLKLVFISRIVPIKNLDFILNVLIKSNELQILLDIYGPIEDIEYWEFCSTLIKQLPNVKYCGELEPEQVRTKLQQYHFSVLPSKHENFGNSIVESWLSGVPVLISDQTPWKQLERDNIGGALPLLEEAVWQDKLVYFQNLDQMEYLDIVNACITFAETVLHKDSVKEANRKLFFNRKN